MKEQTINIVTVIKGQDHILDTVRMTLIEARAYAARKYPQYKNNLLFWVHK